MPPAEKVARQMNEGIPLPAVVGVLVNYFMVKVRHLLKPKENVESMFINRHGRPLGIIHY